PQRKGSGYPPPFDAPCAERVRQRLGNAGGLADFGVNLMRLPPGSWSSQRHWHSHEDEFVYVLEGELTLIEDGGETVLRAGDCATFRQAQDEGQSWWHKKRPHPEPVEGRTSACPSLLQVVHMFRDVLTPMARNAAGASEIPAILLVAYR